MARRNTPHDPAKSTAGCLGKIGYQTRAEADAAKRRVIERRGESNRLNTYLCAVCGHFHLGRNPKDRTKELRRVPTHRADSYRNRFARYLQLLAGE
ncbi:hypothetical protein [Phenylobacterium soli]|uniref:Uncharacterized protein n=1 Tax=Phenylobacterium soli TaxID=2170551 RepID=A0A328ADX2_9CAUL|nr:hypothetical protein [Phenylobacterium soli]RAK51604.1 hypothetical protein DJ017_17360 [Phenylobacterium soli]